MEACPLGQGSSELREMGDMEDIEWLEVVGGGKSQPEDWFDDEMAASHGHVA